jgi:hypothetical protein
MPNKTKSFTEDRMEKSVLSSFDGIKTLQQIMCKSGGRAINCSRNINKFCRILSALYGINE